MKNHFIIIKNPLKRSYFNLIKKVILSQSKKINELNILIIENIDSSHFLSIVLKEYYYQIRKISTSLAYDYDLNINIIFNCIDHYKKNFFNNENSNIFYKATSEKFDNSFNKIKNLVEYDLELQNVILKESNNHYKFKEFSTVSLGGSFDHLHDGHKFLLSMAFFLTKKKLMIGLSTYELYKHKTDLDLFQDFDIRELNIKNFLNKFFFNQFEIFQLKDIYGPTKFLNDLDCLVITKESLSNAILINKYREENNLKKLILVELYPIERVTTTKGDDEFGEKLSSTLIRLEKRNKKYKQLKID